MILLEAANTFIETYGVPGAVFAGLSTTGLALVKVVKSFLNKYLKLQELADERNAKLLKANEDLVAAVTVLVAEIKRDRSTRSV